MLATIYGQADLHCARTAFYNFNAQILERDLMQVQVPDVPRAARPLPPVHCGSSDCILLCCCLCRDGSLAVVTLSMSSVCAL